MNNEHNDHSANDWESEMSREFDKRVRDLHEAPLTFDNVRGKAMTIRRNRRIAVAGGILAAAAVIVPVAVFAGNGLGDSTKELDPAAPTVTRATDPNDPAPTESPAGSLGIAYLEGKTWHHADGSTTELDKRYEAGTEINDVLLAGRTRNANLSVDMIESDGNVADTFGVLAYPVANADHTAVAFIDADGVLVMDGVAGRESVADGFVPGDWVAAVVGDQVFITHGDTRPPDVVDANGNKDVAIPDVVKLNDVSADGRMAAQVDYRDNGSCNAVYDENAVSEVETCDFTFDNFSPDGTHLSGADAYRDGFGQGYVVILDATSLDEVARWKGTEGGATNWVWEDAEHLLITAYEQGEWRIYRLGLDGSSDLVLSSAGGQFSPAFTVLGAS